jgi:Tol biopolymer transport system component
VAFYSTANNLVDGDTNNQQDAFVHDLVTGTTERVSAHSDGTECFDQWGWNFCDSAPSSISADGRYMAFGSNAHYLVDGDTNQTYDAFVRDRLTGMTERVSVRSDGSEANGVSGFASISADGRYVAFQSRKSVPSTS